MFRGNLLNEIDEFGRKSEESSGSFYSYKVDVNFCQINVVILGLLIGFVKQWPCKYSETFISPNI